MWATLCFSLLCSLKWIFKIIRFVWYLIQLNLKRVLYIALGPVRCSWYWTFQIICIIVSRSQVITTVCVLLCKSSDNLAFVDHAQQIYQIIRIIRPTSLQFYTKLVKLYYLYATTLSIYFPVCTTSKFSNNSIYST